MLRFTSGKVRTREWSHRIGSNMLALMKHPADVSCLSRRTGSQMYTRRISTDGYWKSCRRHTNQRITFVLFTSCLSRLSRNPITFRSSRGCFPFPVRTPTGNIPTNLWHVNAKPAPEHPDFTIFRDLSRRDISELLCVTFCWLETLNLQSKPSYPTFEHFLC